VDRESGADAELSSCASSCRIPPAALQPAATPALVIALTVAVGNQTSYMDRAPGALLAAGHDGHDGASAPANDCDCRGELGDAEALLALAAAPGDEALADRARLRAARRHHRSRTAVRRPDRR
jgi:hypothetical protein